MGYESLSDPSAGDIEGVTAGDGLSGGGTEGTVSLALDLQANGGLEIDSTEVRVAAGISQYDVAQYAAGVANGDFLKIATTSVEGRSTAEVLSDIGALPLAGGTMTGNITMGDNQIIIDSTVADGAVSGIVTTGTAGSSMVVGDVIYLAADNAWDPTDADATASAIGMIGISLTAASSGSINILLKGFAMISGIFDFSSAGAPLYLSTTAGDMSQTAPSGSGDVVRVVGYAHDDNDTIYFNPDNSWVEIA